VHDDHRGHDLPRELDQRRDLEAIVQRTHQRDHPRGQQHTVPQLMVFAEARRQPDQPGEERPREDRQAAQERRRALGQAALARLVDRPHRVGEAHRQRRQERRHRGGEQEGV